MTILSDRAIIHGDGSFRNNNIKNKCTASIDKNNSIHKKKFDLSNITNIDICSICLDELQDEDCVTALPNCYHVFHTACIREWLLERQSTYCPLCKSNVK